MPTRKPAPISDGPLYQVATHLHRRAEHSLLNGGEAFLSGGMERRKGGAEVGWERAELEIGQRRANWGGQTGAQWMGVVVV